MNLKKLFNSAVRFLILILAVSPAAGQTSILPEEGINLDWDTPLHFNQWEILIYRPDEKGIINDIRTYLTILDEKGNDVTMTCAIAKYSWISSPRVTYPYRKKIYLSGGMLLHLNIKPGKYTFYFTTPVEEIKNYSYSFNFVPDNPWVSNRYVYDTANPARSLFLYPTADESGFYNGGWHLDYKAPKYYKWTKPYYK